MATARLHLARTHLYAMAANGEFRRLALDSPAGSMDPAALADAATWLRSRPGAGGTVELLLASTRVVFVTVPWVIGTFTGGAIRRQVAQALAATGTDPADWALGIQWPAYGAPTFAVAYPRALLAETGQALRAAGLDTGRAEAVAVAVAKRFGQHVPDGNGLLCFAEDDRLTGVHMDAGAIGDVESVPHDGTGLDSVDVWCRRKRLDYPLEGQLRWLQAAHCPAAFAGTVLVAAGAAECAGTALMEALA